MCGKTDVSDVEADERNLLFGHARSVIGMPLAVIVTPLM